MRAGTSGCRIPFFASTFFLGGSYFIDLALADVHCGCSIAHRLASVRFGRLCVQAGASGAGETGFPIPGLSFDFSPLAEAGAVLDYDLEVKTAGDTVLTVTLGIDACGSVFSVKKCISVCGPFFWLLHSLFASSSSLWYTFLRCLHMPMSAAAVTLLRRTAKGRGVGNVPTLFSHIVTVVKLRLKRRAQSMRSESDATRCVMLQKIAFLFLIADQILQLRFSQAIPDSGLPYYFLQNKQIDLGNFCGGGPTPPSPPGPTPPSPSPGPTPPSPPGPAPPSPSPSPGPGPTCTCKAGHGCVTDGCVSGDITTGDAKNHCCSGHGHETNDCKGTHWRCTPPTSALRGRTFEPTEV
jgi:hypothetical protein